MPPPPSRADKQSTPLTAEERKLCEGKTVEEKFAALRAFRRARGLCQRCTERWSKDHKCPSSVQLHVMQELFELFSLDELEISDVVSHHSTDQLYLVLSKEVVAGTDGPRTLRQHGRIQGSELLILVDSGSSHTFPELSYRCSHQEHCSPGCSYAGSSG